MPSTGYPTATTARIDEGRVPMGRVLRSGLTAIAAAVAANVIVRGIARTLVDISDDFVPLATVWPTVTFTALFLALGVGVFALLNRFTQRPIARFWQIAIAAVLLLTLTPLGARGQEGGTAAAILTLEALHLIAFAVFTPLFTRLLRRG